MWNSFNEFLRGPGAVEGGGKVEGDDVFATVCGLRAPTIGGVKLVLRQGRRWLLELIRQSLKRR
jgi:hypothetical protein